mgnify:CR=1 FL=1
MRLGYLDGPDDTLSFGCRRSSRMGSTTAGRRGGLASLSLGTRPTGFMCYIVFLRRYLSGITRRVVHEKIPILWTNLCHSHAHGGHNLGCVFVPLCVGVFGPVNNGSVTAFLITHYEHSPELRWWFTGGQHGHFLVRPAQLPHPNGPGPGTVGARVERFWKYLPASRYHPVAAASSSPAWSADLVGMTLLPSLPERNAVVSSHNDFTGRRLVSHQAQAH